MSCVTDGASCNKSFFLNSQGSVIVYVSRNANPSGISFIDGLISYFCAKCNNTINANIGISKFRYMQGQV